MKKLTFLLLASVSILISSSLSALNQDITNQIPEIFENQEFKKIPEVAQYKEGDWNNVKGIARNITLTQAFDIAKQNPDITFFFYTTGRQMILEKTDGTYRRFTHGDTVFFGGEPHWGSAPGLADGYIKQ